MFLHNLVDFFASSHLEWVLRLELVVWLVRKLFDCFEVHAHVPVLEGSECTFFLDLVQNSTEVEVETVGHQVGRGALAAQLRVASLHVLVALVIHQFIYLFVLDSGGCNSRLSVLDGVVKT